MKHVGEQIKDVLVEMLMQMKHQSRMMSVRTMLESIQTTIKLNEVDKELPAGLLLDLWKQFNLAAELMITVVEDQETFE